jgi:hypothetical protein
MEARMWDDDEKPLDPELRAKAQARLEQERARLRAMTREEVDAAWEEHRIRFYAEDIEWEEQRKARTVSTSETPSPQDRLSPELCTAVLKVLRENPDMLRAAVRDALREMAEEQKRNE